MRMPHRRPAVAALALTLSLGAAVATTATADDPNGLRAQYFDAIDLSGDPVLTRIDPAVDFDWGSAEPVPGVGDAFSVRWTGTITAPATGRYTFRTRSDDGARLWVDGDLVIDDWSMHAVSERSGEIDLVAGKAVDLKLEYYDGRRLAVAELYWHLAGQPPALVPTTALRPPAGAKPVVTPGEQTPAPVLEQTIVAPALATVPGATTTTETTETTTTPATTDAVPPPPAPLLPPPAPPVAGETFNAEPESGQVLVRRPEDGALIALEQGASLPVGTRLDARNGAVALQTAPAAGFRGRAQQARFSGATFKVGQPRKGGKVVTIDMQHGDFESCDGAPAARSTTRAKSRTTARAARRSSKRVRAIFGSGKGRFRTKGRHAAATVRGTMWTVEDRCDATVTSVKEGVVDVEDLVTGKDVVVRAGESYTARPGR
jgi:hypothetical protein